MTATSHTAVSVGGVAHGPRGPTSYYYMLPMKVRALGLKVALTVKLMQVGCGTAGGAVLVAVIPGLCTRAQGLVFSTGRSPHCGVSGATHCRPPVPDGVGPVPPLGELCAPRGLVREGTGQGGEGAKSPRPARLTAQPPSVPEHMKRCPRMSWQPPQGSTAST